MDISVFRLQGKSDEATICASQISFSNVRLQQLLSARHRTERRFDLGREKAASEYQSSAPAAHPQTSLMSFKCARRLGQRVRTCIAGLLRLSGPFSPSSNMCLGGLKPLATSFFFLILSINVSM